LNRIFSVHLNPAVFLAANLNHPRWASAPLTFTADLVLGKTGNPETVALAKEAVAAARL